MSRVLVVGSIALDTIETPMGRRENILGGSATHFSLSARHFAPVRLVGVVGEDFPAEFSVKFGEAGVDMEGLEVEVGQTFRWSGKYVGTMDSAQTLDVKLNVFGHFRPTIPPRFRDSEYALLGTAAPQTQRSVLEQLTKPAFVMLDTIDFWIGRERQTLLDLLPDVHALCINHDEALLLAQQDNLPRAVRFLLSHGLRSLIVKRANHGASLFTRDVLFSIPAYPTEEVVDPTGAGDAFAGGVLGSLAKHGAHRDGDLKRALVYGSVMGSFAVEGFGTEGLEKATPEMIEQRAQSLLRMIRI